MGTVPALEQIKKRMQSSVPMKWLFTGDSITHGALHTWGYRDYTEHFSERLRYEIGRPRDIVIKTGISGWTGQAIRNDIDWNILQFTPDAVSIMIGMNDCRAGTEKVDVFRDNYRFIIDRVMENGKPPVILHTPNPIWAEAMDIRGSLPVYVDEIRRIAREYDLLLVDHFAYWASAIQEKPIRATAWMNDSLHPGQYGHIAMAHLLLKELGMWDSSSYIARLFVP